MNQLFSLDFWFRLQPMSMTPIFIQVLFVFFTSFIILGAISTMVAKRKEEDRYMTRAYKQISSMFSTMGWLGLIILFFSYEELYLIGSRFWFLVWGIGLLVWAIKIAKYIKVDVPELRESKKSKEEVNKYLPRRSR